MKYIAVKRLVYTNGAGVEHIGGYEYDGNLTNDNILGSVYELGKTQWIGNQLWLMRNNIPTYHIHVEIFYQYQKSWYDLLYDAIRRTLKWN